MIGNLLAVVPDPPKVFNEFGFPLPKHIKESEAGLAIPISYQKQGELTWGEVVGVGTGMPGYPLDRAEGGKFAIGDRVQFRTGSAMEIKINGTDSLSVNINDVFMLNKPED